MEQSEAILSELSKLSKTVTSLQQTAESGNVPDEYKTDVETMRQDMATLIERVIQMESNMNFIIRHMNSLHEAESLRAENGRLQEYVEHLQLHVSTLSLKQAHAPGLGVAGAASKEDLPATVSVLHILQSLDHLIRDEAHDSDTILRWIEAHVDESQFKEPWFVSAMITSIWKAATATIHIDQESGAPEVDYRSALRGRIDLLRSFLAGHVDLQNEALSTLWLLLHKTAQPAAVYIAFFKELRDEKVISTKQVDDYLKMFNQWENRTDSSADDDSSATDQEEDKEEEEESEEEKVERPRFDDVEEVENESEEEETEKKGTEKEESKKEEVEPAEIEKTVVDVPKEGNVGVKEGAVGVKAADPVELGSIQLENKGKGDIV